MGWVFLEIVVALVIAVSIVWWTMPRRPRPEARETTAVREDEEKPEGR